MRTTQECHGRGRRLISFLECSSGSEPAPWCARRAGRSSASTTTSATRAAAATRPVGLRAGAAAARQRSRLRHARRLRLRRAVRATLLADRVARRHDAWAGDCSTCWRRTPRDPGAFGASGAIPVFSEGMWWTVLSAGWLHGSALHILFNMMWVRQLGPATADIYGAGRMVIIYTIARRGRASCSAASPGRLLGGMPIPFLRGAVVTLGASAPIFGLLGALVYYGRRGGSSMVGAQAMSTRWCCSCSGSSCRGIDNYAHAGGFVGGYLRGDVARSAEARADGSPGDAPRPASWRRRSPSWRRCVTRLATGVDSGGSAHRGLGRPIGGSQCRSPPDRLRISRSMIRPIARRQTRQNPTRSRVNMMQSASGR